MLGGGRLPGEVLPGIGEGGAQGGGVGLEIGLNFSGVESDANVDMARIIKIDTDGNLLGGAGEHAVGEGGDFLNELNGFGVLASVGDRGCRGRRRRAGHEGGGEGGWSAKLDGRCHVERRSSLFGAITIK